MCCCIERHIALVTQENAKQMNKFLQLQYDNQGEMVTKLLAMSQQQIQGQERDKQQLNSNLHMQVQQSFQHGQQLVA